MFHDLNIYGDIAESYIELLESEFLVDMSTFEFDRYFPPEFIGDTQFEIIVNQSIPILAKRKRMATYFEPITLSDLERLIKEKSWSVLI